MFGSICCLHYLLCTDARVSRDVLLILVLHILMEQQFSCEKRRFLRHPPSVLHTPIEVLSTSSSVHLQWFRTTMNLIWGHFPRSYIDCSVFRLAATLTYEYPSRSRAQLKTMWRFGFCVNPEPNDAKPSGFPQESWWNVIVEAQRAWISFQFSTKPDFGQGPRFMAVVLGSESTVEASGL